MLALAVALASGAGAVCRYLLDQVVQRRVRRAFPYGTFAVNISGSLLLGLVTGLALHHGLPVEPTVVLSAGFAGGYTTLSTWAWETLALAESGALLAATANAVLSLAVGLAATAAGLGLALL
jgi:fluoride exporter